MPPTARTTIRKLNDHYESLKEQVAHDAKSPATAGILRLATITALTFLSSSCTKIALTSKVPGKSYWSFTRRNGPKKLSRPVNESLFDFNCAALLQPLIEDKLRNISPVDRARLLYTVAMSYCCATDLLKTGDQKTPATYFECLVGHLIARAFSVNPRTQVEVLQLEDDEIDTLPTDFIFDLGSGKPKFHVPVKTSTRERVIQVFAHQRVLEWGAWVRKIQGDFDLPNRNKIGPQDSGSSRNLRSQAVESLSAVYCPYAPLLLL